MAASPRGPRRPAVLAVVVLLSVLAALAAVEVGVRVLGESVVEDPGPVDQLQSWARGGSGKFAPQAYYGWNYPPGRDRAGPEGFLGERPALEKTPGTFRIACLGASTTVRYPPLLEEELERRTGASVECVNWGVHGWSTAETLTNYFLNVQDYDSDLVLILHAWNDSSPRLREGLRADYTHFRAPWRALDVGPFGRFLIEHSRAYAAYRVSRGDRVNVYRFSTWPGGKTNRAALEDLGTARYFVRNVRTVVRHVVANGGRCALVTLACRDDWRDWNEWSFREQGSKLSVMASHQHNELLRLLAREEDVALIDLAAWVRANIEELGPHFHDPIHLDPGGQRLKVGFLADELLRQGLVPAGGGS